MKELSDKRELSLEDVLGMMIMLFDDVRFDTGNLVESCSVNNFEAMIDRLYTVVYTVGYIYSKNKRSIKEYEDDNSEENIWQELNNVEIECNKTRAKIKKLEEEKNKLSSEKEALEIQLSIAREKETEIQKLQQQVFQLNQKISQINSEDLPKLRQECEALEKEKQDCTNAIQELIKRRSQIEFEQEDLSEQKNTAQEEVKRLTFLMEAAKNENDNLKNQIEDLERNNKLQNEEKISCQQKLEALRAEIQDISGQMLPKLQQECESLEKEKADCTEILNELEKKHSLAENQLTSIKAQQEVTRNDINKLSDEIEKSKQEKSALEDELNELGKNSQLIEKEKEDCVQQIYLLKKQIEGLTAKTLPKVKARCESLENEKSCCMESLEKLRQERQQIKAQADDIRSQQETTEAEINSLKDEIEKGGSRKASLQEELENIRRSCEEQKAEIQNLRKQLETEIPAKKSINSEIADVRYEFEEVLKEKTELENSLSQEKEKLEKLKETKQSIQEELQKSREEKKNVTDMINDTEQKLDINSKLLERKINERDLKKKELEELNIRLTGIRADYQMILGQIEERKKQLNEMDKEKIEYELNDEKEKLCTAIKELEKLKEETENIKNSIAQYNSYISNTQEEISRLSLDLDVKKDNYKKLIADQEKLSKKLNILNTDNYKNRVRQCENRISVMKRLVAKIDEDSRRFYFGKDLSADDVLKASLELAESSVDSVQSSISEYVRIWMAQFE